MLDPPVEHPKEVPRRAREVLGLHANLFWLSGHGQPPLGYFRAFLIARTVVGP